MAFIFEGTLSGNSQEIGLTRSRSRGCINFLYIVNFDPFEYGYSFLFLAEGFLKLGLATIPGFSAAEFLSEGLRAIFVI